MTQPANWMDLKMTPGTQKFYLLMQVHPVVTREIFTKEFGHKSPEAFRIHAARLRVALTGSGLCLNTHAGVGYELVNVPREIMPTVAA